MKYGKKLTKEQVRDHAKRHGFKDPLVDGVSSGADIKSTLRDGPLAKTAGKDRYAGKCAVSIVSYRARASDPDALVGKYFLDSLRYAGLLFDDRPEDITYEISQKKTASKKEEKTLVTIQYP